MCGFCMCGCVYVWVLYVWVCVCVGFVCVDVCMCGCFGNMCICIYCGFVFFRLCIFILICFVPTTVSSGSSNKILHIPALWSFTAFKINTQQNAMPDTSKRRDLKVDDKRKRLFRPFAAFLSTTTEHMHACTRRSALWNLQSAMREESLHNTFVPLRFANRQCFPTLHFVRPVVTCPSLASQWMAN